MAGHMAAIAASLNPGKWTKDMSPEENLKTFNKYVTKYERWLDVCDMNLTVKQKWGLFIATEGSKIEDLVLHLAEVEIRQVQVLQAVQAVIANPQQNIAGVAGVVGVVPTPWEQGIELYRAAISKYSQQIMARSKLFTKRPASDYSDWRKWGQELLEQAKRCLWAD